MTFRGPDARRTLVPRWRASNEAANSGEFTSTKQQTSISQPLEKSPHFERLRAEWSDKQSLEVGADLVSSGVALGLSGEEDVQQAAKLVERSETSSEHLRSIARRVLSDTLGRLQHSEPISFDPDQARADLMSQIAAHKFRVRDYPRNAFAWADLSRLYASSGQLEKAHDAIKVATFLAPNNRFVLRSAARFYVHANGKNSRIHIGDGLRLLRRSSLLRHDPWVMAAEIATSAIAEDESRVIKQARAMTEADNLQPWDLSELNGALGTLAIEQGGLGKPSKLFNRSLRKPTENALAQAQWAADAHKAVVVSAQSFESWTAPPFEALALKHRTEGKWLEVISDCREWSAMEPTSTRPLILGGFIAEVALENGEIAREFSERARVLDPTAHWPNNNLAVALAYLNRLDEAEHYATRLQPQDVPEESQAVYWATRGLIEYRRGNREQGLSLYLRAAQTNLAKKEVSVRAMVLWHLLQEEARIGAPGTVELADSLWKRTDSAGVPELSALRSRISDPKLGYRERAAAILRSTFPALSVPSMQRRIEADLNLLFDPSTKLPPDQVRPS
jgi:tetratricopeptide (TPR) repeat protein